MCIEIYRNIQVFNNIRQTQFLTAHSMQKKSAISVPIKDLKHHHPMTLPHDTPKSGRSSDMPYDISRSGSSSCPIRHAVIRHALVATQYNDMPYSGRSFTTCPSRDASFTTCPSRDAVLRHTMVGT